MRARPRRLACLAMLALSLASCAGIATPPVPAGCGPASADRGIGGTGAPARLADRGIGGTGIIGVITGFGSVCVAGREVALSPDIVVRVDEAQASTRALRRGEVVAVSAETADGRLTARTIAVRHEVIGPVEAVAKGSLLVAGQMVRTDDIGPVSATAGQWVAVSGLRGPGNVITATRIDTASSGRILLRGSLTRLGSIGALPVRQSPGAAPPDRPLKVVGRLEAGRLLVEQMEADQALSSPVLYFGASVTHYVVEGYVEAAAGGFIVDHSFVAGQGLAPGASGDRMIAAFDRDGTGALRASSPPIGVATTPRPGAAAGGGVAAEPGAGGGVPAGAGAGGDSDAGSGSNAQPGGSSAAGSAGGAGATHSGAGGQGGDGGASGASGHGTHGGD